MEREKERERELRYTLLDDSIASQLQGAIIILTGSTKCQCIDGYV